MNPERFHGRRRRQRLDPGKLLGKLIFLSDSAQRKTIERKRQEESRQS